jgi:hypothetical protein
MMSGFRFVDLACFVTTQRRRSDVLGKHPYQHLRRLRKSFSRSILAAYRFVEVYTGANALHYGSNGSAARLIF